MRIELGNGAFSPFDIDDAVLIGIYGPQTPSCGGLSDEEITYRVRHPVGARPLREQAKRAGSALIVTDDHTRQTPLKRLAGIVIDELLGAGMKARDITFLVGLGTHRPMRRDEMAAKFGASIVDNFSIVNHSWDDASSLISLGHDVCGFEIVVNKRITENDLVLSIGSIVPHATCGFSGGAKTIMTGVAGKATIENTHWMALEYPAYELLGNEHNKVLDTFYRIGETVNLSMIINVILGEEAKVLDVVAGGMRNAHQQGIALCRKIYGVAVSRKADIIIAEAYPCDGSLRQAIKAVCAAAKICNDTGVIILVAECREGVAPQFKEMSSYGFRNPEELYHDVENRVCPHKLMAYTLVAVGRIISQRARVILVSCRISREDTEKMGFLYAQSVQEAVGIARELTHNEATVAVLRKAGLLLPLLKEKKNRP